MAHRHRGELDPIQAEVRPKRDAFNHEQTRLGQIEQLPWMAPLHGGYPQIPRVRALPTAAAHHAYRMVVLVGTPDIAYICLRDAAAAWGWRTAATG